MLTIMLVMMATLAQFHHHDCQGNVYWHLTLDTDIELGIDGCSIGDCHHDQDGGCRHHHEHHSDCSMHIGAAMISDHDNGTPQMIVLDSAVVAATVDVLPRSHIGVVPCNIRNHDCSHHNNPLIASFHFRGPPVCIV